VVVTGLGTLCSLGQGIGACWQNLLAGKSGITRITRFDATDYPCQVGAEVQGFDPCAFMDPKEAKRSDRYTQFAVAAAKLAIADAQLDLGRVDKTRLGVLVGSGIGGMETIETQSERLFKLGPRKVSPFMIPSLIANIASGVVAIEIGALGPNYATVTACSSSTHAIGQAFRALQYGEADIMLAGGSEAAITRLGYAGFCALRAMATSFNDAPERSSRPFDKDRDGFVMGEGGGVLVLETLEHAQQRGARIYAEVLGYAATCDAFHITMPDESGQGLSLCLQKVLQDAHITPEQVGYINAHGTSTPYNDKFETLAIKAVFGDHAKRLKISSTKSMTGHLLGATGAIEAAAAIMALSTGDIPPTINLDTPDPDCDLDYVPHTSVHHPHDVCLTDNLGFGGHNAALAFGKLR
jgi:3-oxoacyl-[acyl-carrier-protein] synthase II